MKKVLLFLIASSLFVVACNNEKKTADAAKSGTAMPAAESKQEKNKKVIMASMESFMKGDLDGTFKDVAPGFTDYADGSIEPQKNIDSLKAFIKMLMASIENYRGENLKYYADGDYVLVHGDWKGTFNKDFMGIKATGNPIVFKDVDLFKLNDEGKVTEHASVQNLAGVLMVAGSAK